MFSYGEWRNPKRRVRPDIFVVLDRDWGKRVVYRVWEEGKPPDFALEVVSPSSRDRNQAENIALYEWLEIGEYILLQPDRKEP